MPRHFASSLQSLLQRLRRPHPITDMQSVSVQSDPPQDETQSNAVAAAKMSKAAKENFEQWTKADLEAFIKSEQRLFFQPLESPVVSIVLVFWNKAHLSLRCLKLLQVRQAASPRYEIIIVDNASSDHTRELLKRVDGAQIVLNDQNIGFAKACNQGARLARGRAILLLNNDAYLREGTLEAAVRTLDSAPDIGAVGGRLVQLSGLLQEAGAVVWRDGTTLGYGRNTWVDSSDYLFRRDVDYCSAAFLLVPTEVWRALRGFDEAFSPAYYEDVDFSIRLWKAGWRVTYEPMAIVDHYESGSEVSRGSALKLTHQNQELFRSRHWQWLEERHCPPFITNVLWARSRRLQPRRRLLVIDNEVPLAAYGSGYPRMREMLRMAVAAGWQVTFFPLHKPTIDWGAARQEIPWEIEIVADFGAANLEIFLESRGGLHNSILVSRPDNMAILQPIRARRPELFSASRLIYDAEAIFSERKIRAAEMSGQALSSEAAAQLLDAEVALTAGATAVICVTPAEAAVFQERQAAPVTVLSHPTVNRLNTPGFESRRGFLFVGRLLEQQAPNWRGLEWFLDKVWPLIRRRLPEATLKIIGHSHSENDSLKRPGVDLVGPVESLDAHYDEARVFLAPVLLAAGIPIKILEATAAGLPTVGSALMAHLLGWQPGRDLAATDSPEQFARDAIELHERAERWEATRRAAQARLALEHGREEFECRFLSLLAGG